MNRVQLPLQDLFFLRDVSERGIEELNGMLVTHRYPRNNILFYHGETVDSVYILLEGRVNISLINDDGREVVLATIRSGSIFGVLAALDGGAHIGTALTSTDCLLAKAPRDGFIAWMRRHPASQGPLAVEFARMLRAAYSKIGEQSLLPVRRRLLAALVQIARTEGKLGAEGVVTFVRPTHQELAQLVGSSRVVVSRILKELLNGHGIASSGRVIRLPLDRLESELDGDFGA
jgi:CRP/FNR family transcriptional regulator, cyclic AMP receptor protein